MNPKPTAETARTAQGPNMMRAALAYAGRSIPVFPVWWIAPDGKCACGGRAGCKPGKHPLGECAPHGFKSATPDPEMIRRWWGKYPNANIAVPTGTATGWYVVDEDPRHGGDDSISGFEAEHGKLPDTRLQISGGGGPHRIFSSFEPLDSINGILPGVDFKGDKGYILVAPSNHESGRRYCWEVEAGGLPLAPLPESIRQLVVAAHAKKPATMPAARKGVAPAVTSMVPKGERNEYLFKRGCALRRAGLSDEAVLAALKAENAVRCNPPMDDSEVAAAAASTRRYPSGDAPTTPAEWGDWIPLDAPAPEPFPVAVFPGWLRNQVEAVTEALQVPPDLPAVQSLGVLACACGGKVEVQAREGYREPTNDYFAVALPPAERKSPCADLMFAPVRDYERQLVEGARENIARERQNRNAMTKRLEVLTRKAAEKDGPERIKLEDEARQLATELEGLIDPVYPRLLAQDSTPERLVGLLAEQGGRLAVLTDEGGILVTLTGGRYAADKVVSNVDALLHAHGGRPIREDRQGRADYVERANLTLCVAVQPVTMNGFIGNDEFRRRGLVARFKFCVPEGRRGHARIGTAPVRAGVASEYTRKVESILKNTTATNAEGRAVPHVAGFDHDAAQLLIAFEHEIEPSLGEDGELRAISDFAGKLPGAVIRLAGLLHHADLAGDAAPWATPIPPATVERAIRVGRYFLAHALRAFDLAGADDTMTLARRLASWIRRGKGLRRADEGTAYFTRRDAYEWSKGGNVKTVTDIDPALQILAAHSIARPAPTDDGKTGRPSQSWTINPRFMGEQVPKPNAADGAGQTRVSDAAVPDELVLGGEA